MYWRSVVLPMTDLEESVRLCVELPGVRFEGNVVLQPLLAAKAVGSKRSVARDFMVYLVERPEGGLTWCRTGYYTAIYTWCTH